jgi:hypothetical protein
METKMRILMNKLLGLFLLALAFLAQVGAAFDEGSANG